LAKFTTLPVFSQPAEDFGLTKSKEVARQQINKLKNGALLVRLTTKSNSIAALRAKGDNQTADKIQKKQSEINIRTITAFRVAFDFCPVYFFYSDYTNMVKDRQLDKVVFLSDELQPDSSIRPGSENFLVAEFGQVMREAGKLRGGYYYYKENDTLKQSDKYAAVSIFDALVIMDDQFVQMRYAGFPFYDRTWELLSGYKRSVAGINKSLHKFYEKQRQ